MKSTVGDPVDALIDIRSIISGIHDRRTGQRAAFNVGLDSTEMAALRDCYRRLTDVIEELSKSQSGKGES